jgi:hypothetical protein
MLNQINTAKSIELSYLEKETSSTRWGVFSSLCVLGYRRVRDFPCDRALFGRSIFVCYKRVSLRLSILRHASLCLVILYLRWRTTKNLAFSDLTSVNSLLGNPTVSWEDILLPVYFGQIPGGLVAEPLAGDTRSLGFIGLQYWVSWMLGGCSVALMQPLFHNCIATFRLLLSQHSLSWLKPNLLRCLQTIRILPLPNSLPLVFKFQAVY